MSDAEDNISAEGELPESNMSDDVSVPAEPIVEFYVLSKDGTVAREGSCLESLLDKQAFLEGEVVYLGNPPAEEHNTMTLTHTIPRQQAYPTVPEQLDVLWKILGAHPELLGEEGRAMVERIQSVKAAYPKDVIYMPNEFKTCETDPSYVPVQTNLEN